MVGMCVHTRAKPLLLDLTLSSAADNCLWQPVLVLYKSSCFGCDAVRGGSGAVLAPITPGIMKTKLELEASNAIAGQPKTFFKCCAARLARLQRRVPWLLKVLWATSCISLEHNFSNFVRV